MGKNRRATHGKYNTTGAGRKKSGGDDARTLFVRTLSLDAHKVNEREQRTQSVELTVRGISRGMVQMAADDGAVYACAKDNARGALSGDLVLAERIGRDRVVVRKVLMRAHETIVGVLYVGKYDAYIRPMERHLPQSIAVDGPFMGAAEGDVVRTQVTRWGREENMAVRIVERIGSFDEARHALTGLVHATGLREAFEPEVLVQADACREASLADDPEREDLRGLLSFTIDGSDAKDFDDAVSIEMLGCGSVRLGVHIADVGHYVPQGTPLDREAYLRGTSVYLPGRVLPMLPEQLSNGVCSLRPNEDKFTLSALIDMSPEGEPMNLRIVRSITRSKARLVYDDVNTLFDGDEAVHARYEAACPGLCGALRQMRTLAQKIRVRRENDGAIDFDTSEPRFVLDEQGEPVQIIKRERGEAEMMIEDFMLTANSGVAKFAREKGLPILYRVHENPDPQKLAMFSSFLSVIGVMGYRVPDNASPAQIRAVLEGTHDRPEFTVISTLALRSMQKARYDAEPLGHYGLAMEDYCHFTSPIRRYPDLVVSRALTSLIRGERASLFGDKLCDAAQRSSDCERAAVEAERAADKMMMARLMTSHVGEVFEGVISGLSDFGIFVELSNGAEGFIHVRTLEDWFDYDERRMTLRGERTGASFTLGQALRVRVCDVELTQSAIDLELVDRLRAARREKSEKKRERERMRSFFH